MSIFCPGNLGTNANRKSKLHVPVCGGMKHDLEITGMDLKLREGELVWEEVQSTQNTHTHQENKKE